MSLYELVEISSCAQSGSLAEMSDICYSKDHLMVVNVYAFHYKYQYILNQMVMRRHCKFICNYIF